MEPLICPEPLRKGDGIGVFTPSSPAYTINPGLFDNGVKNLEALGFRVHLGELTQKRASEGYRSACGESRAKEFMGLIADPSVRCLISTIGGQNSSSMIPFLDFEAIRKSRKIICGFSDVTSLHLSILHYAQLRTFYGPSVMCWFGEWPDGIQESTNSFLQATMMHRSGEREVRPFSLWSNHRRRWDNGEWQTVERIWQPNSGWTILSEGTQEAPLLAFNLNTLMSAAGTAYFPNLDGVILLLEEMDAPLGREERHFRHLDLLGVFDRIGGLIVSKPENYSQSGAPFGYDTLIQEIVGPREYPIITNFDCGHTVPMETIPQGITARLQADRLLGSRLIFLESAFG